MAIEFTDGNFTQEALTTDEVVMVDFWAEWCGPCKAIGPVIDSIAEDPAFAGKLRVGKLNIDTNPAISIQYGIRSIPTILFLKNGKVVEKQVGGTSRAKLVEKIEAAFLAEV